MQSLVEIYTLQQQVKHKLSQQQYQDIEALFAPLQKRDLQQALHIQFLFTPEDNNLAVIISQLQNWQRATPQSYYPYLFFASFWLTIAAKQRGIQTMERVTYGQHLRLNIANDQFFYWALKALEFNPHSVVVFNMLLEASGRFGVPYWLELPVTAPIDFSWAEYNRDELAFLATFPGYRVPQNPINIALPSPTAEERDFTPFYWLKRILAIDPEHMQSRKTTIRFLAPRWYGAENYAGIDSFLASDYCSDLSELQISILLREKEYDRLTAYHLLFSRGSRKEVTQNDRAFRHLVNTHLNDEEDSIALFEYIDYCYHVLTAIPKEIHKYDPDMPVYVYQSLHRIVKLASAWIIFYRGHEVFTILLSFINLYGVQDQHNLFAELARQTQYRNLASPVESLYRTLAASFPLAGIHHGARRENIEHDYLAAARYCNYNVFRSHIIMLAKLGYATEIQSVIERLASENQAINAAILCFEIYTGNAEELAAIFTVIPNAARANAFLDSAIQQQSEQAILIKSRHLEDLNAGSTNPTEKAALAAERERLLILNIQPGDAVSQYDYACSLIASDDAKRIRQGLYVEAPKVLLDGRVRTDQLGYIAYLYAFCAFNGRGMDKNMFLMDFWIKQALKWDADTNYVKFLLKVREGVGIGFLYNYYLKRDKAKISPEMQMIMRDTPGLIAEKI